MIQVAVISDIHSNIDALDAVIEDINSRGVSLTICSGDIVGYHTFAEETVKRIMDEKIISIKGNHDLDILNKKFNPEKEHDIFEYTYNALSESSLKWLESLPECDEIIVEGVSILVSHGSPTDIEEYLFEDSDTTIKAAQQCEQDILISGHTHLPFVKSYDDTLFINSGSVGKPKIGKPVATWAEITIDGVFASAEIHEVEYNYEPVAKACEESGFKKYARDLRAGRV